MAKRILVVEDSVTQALALQATLEEHGFDVTHADSAENALERLGAEAFDLVLSDIVMPGLSGYDLCRRIKTDATLGGLPVVLLTSLGDPLDIVRGLECGADNYVTKPYEADHLAARIRNVLDRQRLRRDSKTSLGMNVSFLGTTFSITSDKDQILDLFISSVEDVVRTNAALQDSQRALADTQAQLEALVQDAARRAEVSQERYALLMLEANDAILILDVEGRVLEANDRAAELLALRTAELRQQTLLDFATPHTRAPLTAAMRRLRTDRRVEAGEVEFVRADGGRIFCDISASRTRSGEEELVLVILHDITDLKLTTERLGKSEALLMESQRFAQMGSWERDVASGESQWTPELYRIFGLDPIRVVPGFETFLSTVHPSDVDRVRAAYERTLAVGAPLNVEFRIVRPDGAERTVHARAEVTTDGHGHPQLIRGTLQDVTERKHLESLLLQSQKMEAIGQLAGGVAHDFNNLLTVITSYCGLILSDLEESAPLREEVREINAAADRAAALTRQLLAFSRRQVLQPQAVDLNALTANLEKLLRRLVPESIGFVTRLDEGVDLLWADPGQLEQVIMNLVVNARDAMPDGGTIGITTTAVDGPPLGHTGEFSVLHEGGPWVLLEVSDTGVGMSPDVQARIFEPFFTTKPTGHGTGLGLATVYGIVRQSGGEIDVESAPGKGTTFRVYLPAGDGREARPTPMPMTAQQRTPAAGTLLVVEDEDAVREVAARILRRHGFRVIEARTAEEALACCQRERVDLVLTDVVMPEMSGYELGRAVAEHHAGTRVLYMSGYSRDAGVRERIMPEGTNYVEKPFTVESLVAKVREALATPAARPGR